MLVLHLVHYPVLVSSRDGQTTEQLRHQFLHSCNLCILQATPNSLPNHSFRAPDPTETLGVWSLIYIIFVS